MEPAAEVLELLLEDIEGAPELDSLGQHREDPAEEGLLDVLDMEVAEVDVDTPPSDDRFVELLGDLVYSGHQLSLPVQQLLRLRRAFEIVSREVGHLAGFVVLVVHQDVVHDGPFGDVLDDNYRRPSLIAAGFRVPLEQAVHVLSEEFHGPCLEMEPVDVA